MAMKVEPLKEDATDLEKLIHFLRRLDRFDFTCGVMGPVRKEARRLLKELGR